MSLTRRDLLSVLEQIIVGGVFTISGWLKLVAPHQNFMAVIEQYQAVPHLWVEPVSLIVPWIEIIFGVFLLLGFLSRVSAGVLSVLLLSFIGLLGRGILLHIPIQECGCFGSLLKLEPWQALALDTLLFSLALILMCFEHSKLSLDAWLSK